MPAPPDDGRRPPNITKSVVTFAFLAAASFVLGFIGLHRHLPGESLLNLFYFDLQLFVLGPDPLQDNTDGLPVSLQIARFAAPAVAIFAVIETGRVLIFAEYQRRRARRASAHAVVCGDSPVARTLVAQLRAANRTVVVVAERLVGTAESRQRGLMTVVGDAGDPDVLCAAGVPSAEVVYVALGDSAVNLSVAVRASQLAEGREVPLAVYAHISDPELCVSLQARRLGLPQPPGVRLDFFNVDDLAARVLFERQPLPTFGERPTRILIAGGSRLAEALLVQAARHWRVSGGAAHPILAVDFVAPQADAAVGALTARYPFLRRTCKITPVPVELTIALAGGALRTPHDRTFLCYRDENHGLKMALTTHRLWHGRPGSVFVPLYQLTDLSVAFDGGGTYPLLDQVQGRLRLFPMIQAACDPVLIGEDLVERLARLIHEHYVLNSRRAGDGPADSELVDWEHLDAERRRANRDQAHDIGSKLSAIGCVVVPRIDGGPLFEMTEAEIDRLAELEQQRWKQAKERDGWRYGPTRDDALRRSPYLLDWAEMPEEDRRKNRDAIRDLPDILADGGFEIVRLTKRQPDAQPVDACR
ncbi:NAD-binding protein [Luedemannella helvata]|uniref:RCK N-terminal domain-containing protein n=1 Tax=Luedemannella helvata TaxID=349315 RepID=A0ABP4WFB6_9ACTN